MRVIDADKLRSYYENIHKHYIELDEDHKIDGRFSYCPNVVYECLTLLDSQPTVLNDVAGKEKVSNFPLLESQCCNLEGWLEIFRCMPYTSEVMIYDGNIYDVLSLDNTGLIYGGKLQDLTYLDMQTLENYILGHIEAKDGKLILLGYEHTNFDS